MWQIIVRKNCNISTAFQSPHSLVIIIIQAVTLSVDVFHRHRYIYSLSSLTTDSGAMTTPFYTSKTDAIFHWAYTSSLLWYNSKHKLFGIGIALYTDIPFRYKCALECPILQYTTLMTCPFLIIILHSSSATSTRLADNVRSPYRIHESTSISKMFLTRVGQETRAIPSTRSSNYLATAIFVTAVTVT